MDHIATCFERDFHRQLSEHDYEHSEYIYFHADRFRFRSRVMLLCYTSRSALALAGLARAAVYGWTCVSAVIFGSRTLNTYEVPQVQELEPQPSCWSTGFWVTCKDRTR